MKDIKHEQKVFLILKCRLCGTLFREQLHPDYVGKSTGANLLYRTSSVAYHECGPGVTGHGDVQGVTKHEQAGAAAGFKFTMGDGTP